MNQRLSLAISPSTRFYAAVYFTLPYKRNIWRLTKILQFLYYSVCFHHSVSFYFISCGGIAYLQKHVLFDGLVMQLMTNRCDVCIPHMTRKTTLNPSSQSSYEAFKTK